MIESGSESGSQDSNDKNNEICKRGLPKIYELKDYFFFASDLSSININVDKHKKIYEFMFPPVYLDNLDKNNKIDIYKVTKLNGYNAQISYVKELDCWVIGSKNNSCVIREKKDLDNFNQKK
jgi:hypothetical protein